MELKEALLTKKVGQSRPVLWHPFDEWKVRADIRMRDELEALADLGRTPPKKP